MGEQPIFTTKAHVFHIDPNTKKNWIPSSTGSVNVSFYYDSNRSTYRIISVDGSKAIINSTLVPNMSFTKTSQKFGQWSDARANTVYGLGFSNEAELNKFAEKFAEVRDLTKQQMAPPRTQPMPVNGGGEGVDLMPAPPSSAVQNSDYMTPVLDRRPATSNGPAVTDSGTQLKYENDRLKIALAQSSQNAKKWEVELQTLKNNNAKLTTALQESTANVEEWKKQLAAYKEENSRLKKLLIENEQKQPQQQQELNSMQQELTATMDRMSLIESEKRNALQEVDRLKSQTSQIGKLEDSNQRLERQVQDLRRDKADLQSKLDAVVNELELLRSSQSTDKSEMVKIHDSLAQNISELVSAQNRLAQLFNS